MHAGKEAPTETAAEASASWPDDIFEILQCFDVRQVPYVPDAGHSQLIERVLAERSMRAVPLTTEEEGVALLAGAWAGGQRGALLMQSSGVGNCINMLSLTQILCFPFLTLVTMRGEWGGGSEISGGGGWLRPGGVCSNYPKSSYCGHLTRAKSGTWSKRRRGRL